MKAKIGAPSWGTANSITSTKYFNFNSIIVENKTGGERGIRTLDTVARIHAFQACAFNHSATSPNCRTLYVPSGLKKSASLSPANGLAMPNRGRLQPLGHLCGFCPGESVIRRIAGKPRPAHYTNCAPMIKQVRRQVDLPHAQEGFCGYGQGNRRPLRKPLPARLAASTLRILPAASQRMTGAATTCRIPIAASLISPMRRDRRRCSGRCGLGELQC